MNDLAQRCIAKIVRGKRILRLGNLLRSCPRPNPIPWTVAVCACAIPKEATATMKKLRISGLLCINVISTIYYWVRTKTIFSSLS